MGGRVAGQVVGPSNGHRRKGMTGATGCLGQPGSAQTHNLCIKLKEKSRESRKMVHLCTSWSPDSRKCRAASKKESPTVNLPPIRQKRKYKDYSMIAHFSAQARKLWPLDLSASLCALSKMLWVRCHEKMYYRRMPSITLSVNDDGKRWPGRARQHSPLIAALISFSLSFSDSWCLRFERKNSSCAVCSSSERLYTLEVFGSIPNGTVIKYALVLLGWTQRHRCQEVSGVDADVWGELGWVRWGCRSWADWTKGRVGRALGHLAKDGKLIGAAEDRRAVPPTHSPWNIFLPTRPQLTTSTLETDLSIFKVFYSSASTTTLTMVVNIILRESHKARNLTSSKSN